MEIKPIETIYKGYRFRSRLEARWAVFFDALGIEWKYENEGYDLGEVGWYLPDFEIKTRNFGMWFGEVKGNYNDEIGCKKIRLLDDYPPREFMGVMIYDELAFAQTELFFNEPPDKNMAALKAQMLGVTDEEYNDAIAIARQVRFEHGENPCKY